MATVTITHPAGSTAVEARRTPRDDWLVAEAVVAAGSDGVGDASVFEAVSGPFRSWRRRIEPAADGVRETIDFQVAAPLWGWLLTPVLRVSIRRRPPGGAAPWWAPPDRFDRQGAESIALLTAAAFVGAYLGTLLSQTISFAADEFGKETFVQGQVSALTRGGALIALVAVWAADRLGRKRLLLWSGGASAALAVLTALSPTIWWYGAFQLVSRGFATAFAILIAIHAAEEAPAGSRAWVTSVLSLVAGVGSGAVLWLVPLADSGLRTWRWLFVVAGLSFGVIWLLRSRLSETRRFAELAATTASKAPITARMARRFGLLAVVGLTSTFFGAPASNFLIEYLRDERGFEGTDITLYALAIGTPVGIGVAIAGYLADRRGRRLIGWIGLVGGVLFVALRFSVDGPLMWIAGVGGTVVGAATIPALGVYGPELFPTSRRGVANGLLTCVNVVGSVLGLLFIGWAIEQWGFARSFQTIAAVPLVASLAIFLWPRTARRELEELSPEAGNRPTSAD